MHKIDCCGGLLQVPPGAPGVPCAAAGAGAACRSARQQRPGGAGSAVHGSTHGPTGTSAAGGSSTRYAYDA